MDAHPESRQPPRAVDLRQARGPEVEIVACETYDFLLSLHVALASPERDYSDYAVGTDWIEQARARCDAADHTALDTLGSIFGSVRPGGLHATLISLVAECPAPGDVATFLAWLERLEAAELVEALLDQDDLGDDWRPLLALALAETAEARQSADSADPAGGAFSRLTRRFAEDIRPTVSALLRDPEAARAALVRSLRVWEAAVFQSERPRVAIVLARQARALERQRAALPPERFIRLAMHGVEWQRPVGLRRIVFAPSYFCRPAVFYHFRHGTLTFCLPVDAEYLQGDERPTDPRDPNDEVLGLFLTLGDPTRLRILRLLSEREMYLTELADRLELTKATTKHHMVKLRAAHLVTLYDRDRMTYYALVPDIHRRTARLLHTYLGGSSRDAASAHTGS